jgi:hypothetical protein
MLGRLTLVLAATAATLALFPEPADAAPRAPARTKLECRIVFAPGAEGKVRYEADARKRQFMATVEVEAPDDDEADDDDGVGDNDGGDDDIPLFAPGDRLAVTIGAATPPYAVGEIVLAGDDDELEGALKLDAKARGRSVRPFPRDFPALAVGTQVNIGAGSCVLQDRSRPGTGRPG